MNYDERLRQALIDQHNIFFKDGELRKEYREDFRKCPVCGHPDYSIYCVKDGFVHKRCTRCSMVYVDPRLNQAATIAFYNSAVNEVYNEEKFHIEETSVSDDVTNSGNLRLLKNHVPDLRGKRLLEIGPGKGTFLRIAQKEGAETHAVELNKGLISKLKEHSTVYEDDLINLQLPNDYFDVVYNRDLIEHIPNPSEFLAEIYRILKPGGILFMDTPNIDSIVNRATKEWHTIIFAFEHPVQWSPKTLSLSARKEGFTFLRVYYDHSCQTLSKITSYYLYPSFTYIFPPIKKHRLARIIHRIANFKLFMWLDIRGMKFLSTLLGMGATQKIVFRK